MPLTGDDPTVKLRGEINSFSGGADAFLDSVAIAVITVNDGVPEVQEIRKNKYSTVLTLTPGINSILVEIESDGGHRQYDADGLLHVDDGYREADSDSGMGVEFYQAL